MAFTVKFDVPKEILIDCIETKISVYSRRYNSESNALIKDILKTDIQRLESMKAQVIGTPEQPGK